MQNFLSNLIILTFLAALGFTLLMGMAYRQGKLKFEIEVAPFLAGVLLLILAALTLTFAPQ